MCVDEGEREDEKRKESNPRKIGLSVLVVLNVGLLCSYFFILFFIFSFVLLFFFVWKKREKFVVI